MSWWKDLGQLDDDQVKVISLGDGEDHVITGPPGCGKTNLLLLRAAYLHKKGTKNIKVLAFGRVLKEFIVTGASHYPFAPDKVQTFARWAYEVLAANGATLKEEEDFEVARGAMFSALSDIADQGKKENVYDVILLDEAQDYSGEEVAIIRRFCERIFAVGDSNQQITSKSGALERLEDLGARRSTLSYHYRNGVKICRCADGIKNLLDDPKGMEATSNYDEGSYPSVVESVGGLSLQQQVEEAVVRIKTQLQAYPGEMIGVLCARSEDLAAVASALLSSELADELQVQKAGQYSAIDPSFPIVLSTVQGGKGLEFRAVHIMAADKLKNFRAQRNLTYTAATRAKTTLLIYHESDLAGYFEKGLNACGVVRPVELDLKELFK